MKKHRHLKSCLIFQSMRHVKSQSPIMRAAHGASKSNKFNTAISSRHDRPIFLEIYHSCLFIVKGFSQHSLNFSIFYLPVNSYCTVLLSADSLNNVYKCHCTSGPLAPCLKSIQLSVPTLKKKNLKSSGSILYQHIVKTFTRPESEYCIYNIRK